jgi:hypothetical protein
LARLSENGIILLKEVNDSGEVRPGDIVLHQGPMKIFNTRHCVG